MRNAHDTGPVAERLRRATEARSLLLSPAFVLAVGLLLLNDWLLKEIFGNWMTGKLSDLTGLFAFALFWTALLPRRRAAVFVLTVIGFLFWKSPLSESPLAGWNALGLLPLARVVDYTDWLALVALLPAWRVAGRYTGATRVRPALLRRRVAAVASAGVALFAFTATSYRVASYNYDIPDPQSYLIPAAKSEVLAAFVTLGIYVSDLDLRRETPVDTLQIRVTQIPERRVGFTIELRQEGEYRSTIKPLGISAERADPNIDAMKDFFREHVYEAVRDWVTRPPDPGVRSP